MAHLAVKHSAIGEISPESRVATQTLRGIPQHNYFLVWNSRDVGQFEAVQYR